MRRLRSIVPAIAFALASFLAASAGGAAQSVAVTFDVASSTSLTNGCSAPAATSLGTVQPGQPVTTATGAGACTVGFASTNDSVALRIGTRDARGMAMSAPGAAWSTARSGGPFLRTIARSGSTALAAGMWGQGFRSLDDGQNWAWVQVLTSGDYVFEVDPIPGTADGWVAVGGNANIRSTANFAGSAPAQPTWVDHRAALVAAGWPAGVNIEGVAAASASRWFVAGGGGRVGRTNDGGATWTVYTIPGVTLWMDVDALDANTAYLAGSNATLAQTTSGGTNAAAWSVATHPTCNCWFQDVDAANATHVYGSSDSGQVTRWNGSTFTDSIVPVKAFEPLSVSSPASAPSTVFVGTSRGYVWRSTDAGATFTRSRTAIAASLQGIEATSATAALVAGGSTGIARTTDGTTWATTGEDAPNRPLRATAVHPVDGLRAIAVGGVGRILRTTDGGATWASPTAVTTSALHGVTWVASGVVVAVGEGGTIVRSTDGGATWVTRSSGTSEDLLAVAAGDAQTVWAVGLGGTMLRSTDGGSNWTTVSSGTTEPLQSVSASGPLHAVASGQWRTVRRTADGGATVVAGGTNLPWWETIRAVASTSPTTTYAATSYEGIWRSTDGGATYARLTAYDPVSSSTASLAAAGSTVWAVDRWGVGGVSRDGGATWSGIQSFSGVDATYITAISAIDPHTVAVVDDLGTIRMQTESSVAVSQVADYGTGGSSFASAAAAGTFGVCLQSLTAGLASAPWTPDGGTCTPVDSDPWRGVPTTLQTVATASAGASASATFVWGAAPRLDQVPGTYRAAVAFEAIAPAA